MPELNATVENSITSQTLCELQLWSPEQSSITAAVSLSVDLDFDVENIQFATKSFDVRVRKATVHLNMTDADLLRGSRLGEHVVDPYMVAEVSPRTIPNSNELV